MATAERGELPDRRDAHVRRVSRLLGLTALVFPLAIVAVYYLAGWQAAVLLFPAPFVLALVSARLRPQTRFRKEERSAFDAIAGTVALAGLVALPISAVISNNAEWMRAWAYLVAIPIALLFAGDKDSTNNLTGASVSIPGRWLSLTHAMMWGVIAVLFVGGSELIWLASSMDIWIWYHAFAVPIFLLMMLLVQEVLAVLVGRPANSVPESAEPPERSPGDVSAALGTVFCRRTAGPGLIYRKVSLSQTQVLAADILTKEIVHSSMDERQLPVPNTKVFFDDGSGLTFWRDGAETFGVRWNYFRAPRRLEMFGSGEHFAATQVAAELMPTLIHRAWNSDWDGMMELLRPFSPVDMLS